MSWAYNAAGQKIWLPERPLEPPDCWREDPGEPEEEEYDRWEAEERAHKDQYRRDVP